MWLLVYIQLSWLSYAEHYCYVLRFIPSMKIIWKRVERGGETQPSSEELTQKSAQQLPFRFAFPAKKRHCYSDSQEACVVTGKSYGMQNQNLNHRRKSRQPRSVHPALLFSPCLLEQVANALSFLRWYGRRDDAHSRGAGYTWQDPPQHHVPFQHCSQKVSSASTARPGAGLHH